MKLEPGTTAALLGAMAIRDYRELACWRLADEAMRAIVATTRDRRFDEYRWLRTQLQRSSSSACSDMAEGFARFNAKEFAHYLVISRGSLTETLAHLDTAASLDLIDAETHQACTSLLRRSRAAATRLMLYLKSVA